MKFHQIFTFAVILIFSSSICGAQGNPKLVSATVAVLNAFETHDIVMFGEIH